MSFGSFEDAVNSYTNEISTYKEQLLDYKNQLKEYSGNIRELIISSSAEIGIPLVTHMFEIPSVSKVLGSANEVLNTKTNELGSLFIRVPPRVDAPVSTDVEAIPAPAFPKSFAAPEPIPRAPASPWERPPTEIEPPTQDEALALAAQQERPVVTNDLLPEGAGQIVSGAEEEAGQAVSDVTGEVSAMAGQAVSDVTDAVSGAAEQAVSVGQGLATQAGEALSQLTSGVSEGVTSAAEAAGSAISDVATSAAEAAGSVISDVATTAATAAGSAIGEAAGGLAASAAGGPVGLVLGGLIAVGTILAEAFGHHHTAQAPVYNPDEDSIPIFQSGLATGA